MKKQLKRCTAVTGQRFGIRCELSAQHTRKRIPHQAKVGTGTAMWGVYLNDPPPPPPIWDVKIEKYGKTYKVIFNINQQYFDILEVTADHGLTHKAALTHARFIKKMFLKALARLKPAGKRGTY